MAMETTQGMVLQSWRLSMSRMPGTKKDHHLWPNVKKHGLPWLSRRVSIYEGDSQPFACSPTEIARNSPTARSGRSSLCPFFLPDSLSIASRREGPARVIRGLCLPMNGRLAGQEVDPCVWEYWNDLVLGQSLTEGFCNPRGTTTSGTLAEPVHWRNEVRRGLSTEAWLGRHKNEEGDWQFSPEWWGTHGGGWGHNTGDTVFEFQSSMGNGVISVTSHPASTPKPEEWTATEQELQQKHSDLGRATRDHGQWKILRYEWRVLRFNAVTRQSVAKVMAVSNDKTPSEIFLVQQPNCIAFEYVKSMLSVGLTTMSLGGYSLEQVAHKTRDMRILCIGLGGGSLPLFLAHNLPGATLDVVEIDDAVIKAAVESMGYPPCIIRRSQSGTTSQDSLESPKHGIEDQEISNGHARAHTGAGKERVISSGHTRGHTDAGKENDLTQRVLWESVNKVTVFEADGEAFVEALGRRESAKEPLQRQYYDLVFVDAFDGQDVVPSQLWTRGGPFLTFLSQLLHPKHGTVVVNLHSDSPPPSILEKATGQYGPGFDPSSPQGRKLQEACWTYRDSLISPATGKGVSGGIAFTVAVPSQGNISLVVSRGFSVHEHFETKSLNQRQTPEKQMFLEKLKAESKYVQKVLNCRLDLSKRVCRGFHVVQETAMSAKVR